MMFNNHYCIQGICNRGFTLDCVLDILWIGFIFVTDKNWFYLVSICILNMMINHRLFNLSSQRNWTSDTIKQIVQYIL